MMLAIVVSVTLGASPIAIEQRAGAPRQVDLEHLHPDPYFGEVMFRLFELMTPAERTEKVKLLAVSKDPRRKLDAIYLLSRYFFFMEKQSRLQITASLLSDSDPEVVFQMLSSIHELSAQMIPLLPQIEPLMKHDVPRISEEATRQVGRIREAKAFMDKSAK